MNEVEKYQDIIDLDRPISRHSRMARSDRAAQFSPFAALTTYHEKISELEDSQDYPEQDIIDYQDI